MNKRVKLENKLDLLVSMQAKLGNMPGRLASKPERLGNRLVMWESKQER